MKNKQLFVLSMILIFGAFGFSNTPSSARQAEISYNIPDTPEATAVMETIERAYDIEVYAAYTFDLSKFPTVFINDPRFPVSPGTLETVRELTNNPSLESAGLLDYKTAYYSWTRDAILLSESVHAQAKQKNRELTAEERKLLIDSKGRMAPARSQSPKRKLDITFFSVEINDSIATAIVDDGPRTVRLTLVLVDKKWYIAAYKGLELHP